MHGLLADVNSEGQYRSLIAACRSAAWRDIWEGLDLRVYEFGDVNLDRDASDVDVWRFCQRHELVLITGNRNEEDATSLAHAIRALGGADSLPVVTIADMGRVLRDRAYCERAAVQLLEYLMDVERYRGSGRLFIP